MELVTTIPVAATSQAAVKQVVFSLSPGDLAPFELLLCTAEFEVTNDLGAGRTCSSPRSLSSALPRRPQPEPRTEASRNNATPDVHHGQYTKVGTFKNSTSTLTSRYLNLVAYATMSSAVAGTRWPSSRTTGGCR